MATLDNNGAVHDYQGNTWDWALEFYDDEAGTIPTDVSTWIFFFAVKENASDPDGSALVVHEHQAGASPLDDPINGKVVLRVPSDVTKTVPANTGGVPYVYTLKRVIPQGAEPPLVETLEVGAYFVDSQVLQQDTVTP